jgi:glucosylceramidase
MKVTKYILYIGISFMIASCKIKQDVLIVDVYETSAIGNNLKKLADFSIEGIQNSLVKINLFPSKKRQKITGFGGSFTEASSVKKIEIPS